MCLPILMMMLCSTKAYVVSAANRLFGTLFLNDKWMLLDLVTSFSRPCFDFAGNSWFCRGLICVILIQFWMLKVQVCVWWFWIKCVPLAHPLLIQSCFSRYLELNENRYCSNKEPEILWWKTYDQTSMLDTIYFKYNIIWSRYVFS